jgi:hypothetical protein
MKKHSILSAVFLFLIAAVSCNRDEYMPDNPKVTVVKEPLKEIKMNSGWIGLALAPSAGQENALEGNLKFDYPVIYDKNDYAELVFVRNPLRTGFSTTRIPGLVNVTPGGSEALYDFNFLIDEESFTVFIRSINGGLPDTAMFTDFRYRYIVVHKSVLSNHSNINWNNYTDVARVLGI